jgi:hypothetical protein
MPLSDILAALLSRPAGRVLDGPIRAIVREALTDHGYASPAEVQALRDEIVGQRREAEQLSRRAGEVEARLVGLSERAEAGHREARAAQEQLLQVQAELAAAQATIRGLEQRPSLSTAPPCRVEGCAAPSLQQGFCLAHHQEWIQGTLPDHVGPEGLIEVEGRPWRLEASLAGEPYVVMPNGAVRAGGRLVKRVALPA